LNGVNLVLHTPV